MLQGPVYVVRVTNASKATEARVLSHSSILEVDMPAHLIEEGMTTKLEDEFPAFVYLEASYRILSRAGADGGVDLEEGDYIILPSQSTHLKYGEPTKQHPLL